jgi:hypothetical protein
MTPDLLKWAASLGVGGILAAGMFWVYRKDMRDAERRIELMQQNTMAVAERVLDALAALAPLTAALTQLVYRHHAGDPLPPPAPPDADARRS